MAVLSSSRRLLFNKKPSFLSNYYRCLIHFHAQTIPNSNLLHSAEPITNAKEAIRMLEHSSNTWDTHIYVQLLDSCIQSKSLEDGKKIHHHLLKTNTHINNLPILEKLTRMYLTCGDTDLARQVFDETPTRNVILWNSVIRSYAWNGPLDQAIELYNKMQSLGIEPNKYTFPFVIKACSGLKALSDGKRIHDNAKRIGLDSDVYVCTALVDFYAKCGCLDEGRIVFDKMPYRDVVAWNAMIAGSSLHGFYREMMNLVFEMQDARISPNSSTIAAICPAVGQAKALGQGKNIHGYCVRKSFSNDVLVATALLDMYGKCEFLGYAEKIFYSMSVKNEVTWSAMIGAYVLCDQMKEALVLFDRMFLEETVNLTPTTLGTVLRACAKLTDVNRGKQIHGYSIRTSAILDIMVGNSLLSMYSKCGILDDAVNFFEEMESKDTVSYSAIISGCVQNGNAEEALQVFQKMQTSGIDADVATMVGILPACSHLAALQHGRCSHGYLTVRGFASETSIGNALIDMYSKCGRPDFARKVFNRMPKRDLISWNTIIAGYGIHGLGKEVLLLFQDMLNEELSPDNVTFIGLLSACSHSGLVSEGKHWFNMMTKDFNIPPRMEHCICMVDLLGRGGFLDEASYFINKMPFEPDVRVWGALLSACRIHDNITLGEEVSKKIHKLGPEGTGNFVLLSNIFSAAGRWNDAADVRILQKDQGFRKIPGCSWIEIDGNIHAFVGGDRSHSQLSKIYLKLDELLVEMKKLGYHGDHSFVLQDVEEEEKERSLLYHSEKLAIAFGILSLSPSKPLLVTKNLRVCGDCHTAIKLITTISKRAITVRDISRFHHFKDGKCNCGDFW